MTNLLPITITLIAVCLVSCNNRSSAPAKNDSVDPITKVIKILVDTPRSFVKNYGINDSNLLFVFVGAKIAVEPLLGKLHSMDNGVKAKYAIIEKVYGNFTEDTIEFIAYDHYGTPEFAKYKNALLFVSADSGTYYQQKYMYNDVYKTKNGRWAGTYAGDDYEHEYNRHTKIKPVKIDFAEKPVYPTKRIDDDGNHLTLSYPKPYFKTVGDTAIGVYGNYIDDLFKLKRDGYLTARGLFGFKNSHTK